MMIETTRLILIPADEHLLRSAIQGSDSLSHELRCRVSPDWTEFGTAPLEHSLKMLELSKDEKGWGTYFPIHKTDRRLIGSCGYKGRPTVEGAVELGYEVAPEYRLKGIGAELVKGLMENAFRFDSVLKIVAYTLPSESASTSILKKLNFRKTAELNDPEDGLIWRWEKLRT